MVKNGPLHFVYENLRIPNHWYGVDEFIKNFAMQRGSLGNADVRSSCHVIETETIKGKETHA